MDNRPIGIFDSGLGGLTTVKELRKLLPGENIVYFGDTGRVPYGTRSKATLLKYIGQDLRFLQSKNVKGIICACGTASSNLQYVEKPAGIPVIGVVNPAADAAAKATKNGKVLVLGTSATVSSGSYQQAIANISKNIEVRAVPCPLFVPLVENGHFSPNDEMAGLAAREYLLPALSYEADTVILGCTHFPLLSEAVRSVLGDVVLIDAGKETAYAAVRYFGGMINKSGEAAGISSFYVSDSPDNFGRLAGIFMGESLNDSVEYADIETF